MSTKRTHPRTFLAQMIAYLVHSSQNNLLLPESYDGFDGSIRFQSVVVTIGLIKFATHIWRTLSQCLTRYQTMRSVFFQLKRPVKN